MQAPRGIRTPRWSFTGNPSASQLDEIAAVLRSGGVLLLPTDTIYGLHAVATDEAAVARIAGIKGRDESKPFIVLAASVDQLSSLGVVAGEDQIAALEALWPAPLTVILPLARAIPASRGAASLAVRIPDLEWLRSLVRAAGPLVSTSANRSGEPAVHEVAALASDLQARLDGIADAGRLDGKPSAILDLTGNEPRMVRERDSSFTQFVWKSLLKKP